MADALQAACEVGELATICRRSVSEVLRQEITSPRKTLIRMWKIGKEKPSCSLVFKSLAKTQ